MSKTPTWSEKAKIHEAYNNYIVFKNDKLLSQIADVEEYYKKLFLLDQPMTIFVSVENMVGRDNGYHLEITRDELDLL